MNSAGNNIQRLIDNFRQYSIDSNKSIDDTPVSVLNRGVNGAQKCYLQLRDSEEGRLALMALMEDSNAAVAMTAATYSIFWDEEKARRVLIEISHLELGRISINAEMALTLFEKGKLSFDWD